jgi:DNA-binding transcriptional LysR family regulator
MELRELRAFVAVVEEGGLSAAARRLHVSQPSLTQTVHALERELGVPLLTRTSTGTTPTGAGSTLLTEARAVLARYEQAVAAVAQHGSVGGGVLRLGVPLELPPDLLAKPFADLAKACPDTRVSARHLSTVAQFAALRSGELDVGLVREHPIGPDLDAVRVVDEPLGVLLAAGIAGERAGATGVRLEALAGLDWVGFPRARPRHRVGHATTGGPGVPAGGEARRGGLRSCVRVRTAELVGAHPRARGVGAARGRPGGPPHLGGVAGQLPPPGCGAARRRA